MAHFLAKSQVLLWIEQHPKAVSDLKPKVITSWLRGNNQGKSKIDNKCWAKDRAQQLIIISQNSLTIALKQCLVGRICSISRNLVQQGKLESNTSYLDLGQGQLRVSPTLWLVTGQAPHLMKNSKIRKHLWGSNRRGASFIRHGSKLTLRYKL